MQQYVSYEEIEKTIYLRKAKFCQKEVKAGIEKAQTQPNPAHCYTLEQGEYLDTMESLQATAQLYLEEAELCQQKINYLELEIQNTGLTH